jgi:hypothetical protein
MNGQILETLNQLVSDEMSKDHDNFITGIVVPEISYVDLEQPFFMNGIQIIVDSRCVSGYVVLRHGEKFKPKQEPNMEILGNDGKIYKPSKTKLKQLGYTT